MKLVNGWPKFSDEEYATFAPTWLAMSDGDEELISRRRYLAKKLIHADEIALVDGRDPLINELNPFMDTIKQKASSLKPQWDSDDLREFCFFVFWHEESVAVDGNWNG